jgi:membrane protease YdiL (CAAX protease family)
MPASGLQIAFLMFAVQFFAMLVARALQPHLDWAGSNFLLLANLVAFAAGAALLFGIPALRRHCLALLAKPARLSATELAAALATKAAIPFALVGIAILATAGTGDAAYAQAMKRHVDAQAAWQWLLSPAGLAQTVLLAWLIGPVIEEIVFRGLMQPAFEARWGWARATIVNAILFGAIHPTHMASAAIGSLVMACVWRRTGSLRDCIVVHIGYNIVISWPLLGQWLLAPPTGPYQALAHWVPHLLALAIAAVALPAWVAWSARAPRGEPGVAMPGAPSALSTR